MERKRAAAITQLAEGNLNLSFRLSENEADDSAPLFIEWMRACFKKSFGNLVVMSEDFHALDKLRQRNIMQYGINMMRESLLKSSGADELHRIQGEELKFIQDFSKVMDVFKIEKSYKLMNDAAYHLERNGSAKMIFLDLSLQLSKTINP